MFRDGNGDGDGDGDGVCQHSFLTLGLSEGRCFGLFAPLKPAGTTRGRVLKARQESGLRRVFSFQLIRVYVRCSATVLALVNSVGVALST